MPKMEKVYLHNPSSEETITLVSISATTSHFHASFFQNRVSYSVFSKMSFLFLLPTPNSWSLLNELLHFLILYQLPSKFERSTETHVNSPRREGVKYCIGVPTMLVYTVTARLPADLLC